MAVPVVDIHPALAVTWKEESNELNAVKGAYMWYRMKVGSRVARGQHWSFKDDDGSPPGEGTVTHKQNQPKAHVVWHKTGKRDTYNMGVADLYHLKLLPNPPEVSCFAHLIYSPSCIVPT